jgi:hypothetical protein
MQRASDKDIYRLEAITKSPWLGGLALAAQRRWGRAIELISERSHMGNRLVGGQALD